MRRPSIIIGLVIGLTVLGCAYISLGQSDAGWTTLIDGATGLDNWNRIGDANWRSEAGAIIADKGKGGFLVSKSSYKDFQIQVKFWADHTTNSGVFLRCSDPKAITATNAYEVNIYDQRPEPAYGTGGIVNVAKVSPMPKAGGTRRDRSRFSSTTGPRTRPAGRSSGARFRSSLCREEQSWEERSWRA
jgi:3-keto-disaccharide hydrolase